MGQKETILKELEARGEAGIRSDWFYQAFMPRGSARILDLKNEGHNIRASREGKFTRYVLVPPDERLF